MRDRLYKALNFCLIVFISCFISAVIIRLIESVQVIAHLDLEPAYWLKSLNGIFFDLFTWMFVCACCLIFVLPLVFLKSLKPFQIVFCTLTFVLVIANIILSLFYTKQFQLLDGVVFTYSYEDVMYASKVSNDSTLIPFIIIAFVCAVCFLMIYLQRKKTYHNKLLLVFPFLLIVSLVGCYNIQYPMEKGLVGQGITNNKLGYFIYQSYDFFEEKKKLTDDISDESYNEQITEFVTNGLNKEQLSTQYPLLCKAEKDNPLGNFFELKDAPPNVVIIIVESLSKAMSGKNARLGTYTPFLDSLSKKSLYFPNFISTAERTFNVLPATVGSLPYSDRGFMDHEPRNKFPVHYTLIDFFGKQKYYSRFYVGCYTAFSNMDGFFKNANIDYIINNWDEKYMSRDDKEGYGWGYPDGLLFEKSFEDLKPLRVKSPRFDIIITVTSHAPFKIPRTEYFKKKFQKQYAKNNYNALLAKEVKSYEKELLSIMYVDESLEEYFKQAEKNGDLDNTIYFIYGDHAMPETDLSRPPLEKYHVPMFIYSKLLKRPKQINSVSSHLDIPLSIMNLFKSRYNVYMPDKLAFLGKTIDTTEKFRSNVCVPFMLNNKSINEIIKNDKYYFDGRIYQVSNNLNIDVIQDDANKHFLERLIEDFKLLNYTATFGSRLYDQEIKKYLFARHLTSDFIIESQTVPLNSEILMCKVPIPKYPNLDKFSFEFNLFPENVDFNNLELKVIVRSEDNKVIYEDQFRITNSKVEKNPDSYNCFVARSVKMSQLATTNPAQLELFLVNKAKQPFKSVKCLFKNWCVTENTVGNK